MHHGSCPCLGSLSCDYSSDECKVPCNNPADCGDDECCLSMYSGVAKRETYSGGYAGFCEAIGHEGDSKFWRVKLKYCLINMKREKSSLLV